jgi:hypothetical protein
MDQVEKAGYGQELYTDPVEKRLSPRFAFSPAVEATDIQANIRIVGRLSDISRSGCYIDTISPLAKDAAVTLTISKDGKSFRTQATVVYSKVGMGMGVSFTTSTPEQLLVLEAWLSELCGGEPASQGTPTVIVQPDDGKGPDHELRNIISELIALLNGKNVVSDSEGMALLRKLSK